MRRSKEGQGQVEWFLGFFLVQAGGIAQTLVTCTFGWTNIIINQAGLCTRHSKITVQSRGWLNLFGIHLGI